MQGLQADLSQLLPPQHFSFEPETVAHYSRDWTKNFDTKASAVVFPTSTEEVLKIVRWARAKKIALVPSGGRTGLSGGACALNGEIVVSTEKMNRVLDFNPIDRTVTCEAGVVTEALQKYVHDKGYYFPVDFASRGSSQIGGNVATNAGGIKVLRYGNIREWVAGMKVVTGTGEILSFNKGLVKNNTGLDFRHLFIGSEGVLGFITEVSLRFTTPTHPLTVMCLGVPDLDNVMKVFQAFRDRVPLTAFEFFSELALQQVIDHTGLPRPFAQQAGNYLVVEIENAEAGTEEAALAVFEACVEKGWVVDGAIAQSEAQARDFWRLREDISEATAKGSPYKNDISVTVAKVPEFLRQTDAIFKKHYPDFKVIWFGHIGDGNMHINILKPKDMAREEFLKRCHDCDEMLFSVIEKMEGSVSAEHGVGLVKKPYLHFTRSPGEIALIRQVKAVFDPDGILNPGKMI